MNNLEYFQKRTDERLESIEGKLDKLLEFKFRLMGASAAISAVVSFIFFIAEIYFKTK